MGQGKADNGSLGDGSPSLAVQAQTAAPTTVALSSLPAAQQADIASRAVQASNQAGTTVTPQQILNLDAQIAPAQGGLSTELANSVASEAKGAAEEGETAAQANTRAANTTAIIGPDVAANGTAAQNPVQVGQNDNLTNYGTLVQPGQGTFLNKYLAPALLMTGAGLVLAPAAGALGAAVGGAGTVGAGAVTGATVGAGTGALSGAINGGNIGKDALIGAIGGGATGALGASGLTKSAESGLSAATGASAPVSDAVVTGAEGAGLGALRGTLTGNGAGNGAIVGGVGGAASGAATGLGANNALAGASGTIAGALAGKYLTSPTTASAPQAAAPATAAAPAKATATQASPATVTPTASTAAPTNISPYNFNTPGLGYQPMSQTNYANTTNFNNYGQGPQASFFAPTPGT